MEDIAYKPLGTIKPSDADYKAINQMPPYDDSGVSFKGYSKKKIAENTYQLNPQTARAGGWFLTNLLAGFHETDRKRAETTKLYITRIHIHCKINSAMVFPQVWQLYDLDKNNQAVAKFVEYFLSGIDSTYTINLAEPLEFSGLKFVFYVPTLAINDYLYVQYFGWEE